MEVGEKQPMCQMRKKNFNLNPIFRFFAQNRELKSKAKENKNMNKQNLQSPAVISMAQMGN